LNEPSFDHYYLYDEIAEFLFEINLTYPNISKLHSIGKTPQGRDIWLIEYLTRRKETRIGSLVFT
jgi:hypothetical protein